LKALDADSEARTQVSGFLNFAPGSSLGSRNRCQRLNSFDGAPHAKADAFGHLRKVDHVVGQEDEHRTFAGILHAMIEGLVFQRLLTPELVPDEIFRAAFGALAMKPEVE
jgi:hypothetical protein